MHAPLESCAGRSEVLLRNLVLTRLQTGSLTLISSFSKKKNSFRIAERLRDENGGSSGPGEGNEGSEVGRTS